MPKIMGILNITPDSFSDGGNYLSPDQAIAHACKLVEQGADIIDIGAESTRPGSKPITLKEELDRLKPIINRLGIVRSLGALLSIDTYKPEVAQLCLDKGFNIVNDVTGLSSPDMRKVVAQYNCTAIIMHQGPADTTQLHQFFQKRIALCNEDGVTHLIIDPGFGFGKTPQQNWEILNNLSFRVGGQPLLIGTSRKSFHDGQKSYKTIDTLRIAQGYADIIRIHDLSLLKKL